MIAGSGLPPCTSRVDAARRCLTPEAPWFQAIKPGGRKICYDFSNIVLLTLAERFYTVYKVKRN